MKDLRHDGQSGYDPRDDLDDIVDKLAGGHYVVPIPPDAPRYNIRELDHYCKERGVKASDLTEAELQRFRTN